MLHHFRNPLSWVVITLLIALIIVLFVIPPGNNEPAKPSLGTECVVDADCPQYRCPGVRALCIDGFCKPVDLKGEVTSCIDLKNPVCGNGVCEGNEINDCSVDCA